MATLAQEPFNLHNKLPICLTYSLKARCLEILIKVTWNMEYSIRNIHYVDFVLIHWRSYEEERAYST